MTAAGGTLVSNFEVTDVVVESANIKVDFETTTTSAPTLEAPTIILPGPLETSQRPTISWSAVTGAIGYEVWIKNQTTDENPFHTATVDGTTYTPTVDLGIGRFNLWVRTLGAGGAESDWTPQSNFRIVTKATFASMDRFQSTARPTLSWDTIPGATQYDVWINDHAGNVNQLIRETNVTTTSFTPSSDLPLGQYRAWVRGLAADGSAGQWASMAEFFVVPSTTVTSGQNPTFDQTPTFGWNAIAGAATYEVFVRNRNTGATTIHERDITETSFAPSAELTEGPYRWWVKGVSSHGVSSTWTAPTDIYVGGRTEILSPLGVTTDTTPTFTWRPVDGVAFYDFWVEQIDGIRQIIRDVRYERTTFTPTTALQAGSYRVWVRAFDPGDEVSPWNAESTFDIVLT